MKEPYRRRKMRFRNDSADYFEFTKKGKRIFVLFPFFTSKRGGVGKQSENLQQIRRTGYYAPDQAAFLLGRRHKRLVSAIIKEYSNLLNLALRVVNIFPTIHTHL